MVTKIAQMTLAMAANAMAATSQRIWSALEADGATIPEQQRDDAGRDDERTAARKAMPGDGIKTQTAASGARANGFGASVAVPVRAEVTLMVGAMRDEDGQPDRQAEREQRRPPTDARRAGGRSGRRS